MHPNIPETASIRSDALSSVNIELAPKERIARYLSKGGNPYTCQWGDITVHMEFLDTEHTLQDCLETFLISKKQEQP